MRMVSVEQARVGLGDLVDRARLAGEPTLIICYGRPAAVVVSQEWYKEAEQALAAPGGAANVPPGGSSDH
jgi:prevent-host-death family protein